MFCNKCGKEINNDAMFCPYCGEKTVAFETMRKDEKSTDTGSSQKKKSKIVLFAVVLLVCGLIGAGAYYLRKSLKKADAADSNKESPAEIVTGKSDDSETIKERDYYQDALISYQNEEFDQTISQLNKAIENDETNRDAFILRGDAYVKLAEKEKNSNYRTNAAQDYEAAMKLEETDDVKEKLANCYLSIADSLLSKGNNSEAKTYLQESDQLIQSSSTENRIKAIEQDGEWEDETGNLYNAYGDMIRRVHYDSKGSLAWYQTFTYDENHCMQSMTSYSPDGTVTGSYNDFTYDEASREIKGFVYSAETGKPVKYSISSYRPDGSIIESVYYLISDDSYGGRAVYQYDEAAKRTTGYEVYNERNQRTMYAVYDYDQSGNMIGSHMYNDNGSYLGYESEMDDGNG